MKHFCLIVDFCRRPVLSADDLDDLDRSAKEFYKHVEECYYQFDRKRVGIMKSTVHSLLHLRRQVERYGPFTNYNQFWLERRVGDEKKKLNATRLAAESMTERGKLFESYKIFFDEHFICSNDECLETDNNQNSQGTDTSSCFFAQPLLPCNLEQIDDPLHRSYGMRSLTGSYLSRKG